MDIGILVKKAKEGDQNSLVKLVMLQKEDYFKLAYIYLKNSEDAMDAIEDMIVILYEKITRLKKEDAFYSWSKTILVNCCKSIIRKRKKIIFMDILEEPFFDDSITQKDQEILLEKYLSQLNKKQQEVIRLRFFLDLDYQTIGEIVKAPVGTVKSRISTGLRKLRESLGDDDNE